MDISQLPDEISYSLAINADYFDLPSLFSLSKVFSNLKTNPLFWQWRAQNNFGISEKEFSLIDWELRNPEESYIRVSGEHGIPIPGAENMVTLVI